ncbi:GSCOCG00008854001-RA-CDS [Cotesia congregata]|uniref:Translation initiation factor eIF2B subunit gamma n=1 Tax=Cotesia congregata TaxID=51543 RepID=A0A8J2MR85_COTCN|nr:GSCOCG00008854001-RA-CDS [Cotesia congregata]CAG5104360.1 Similar to Eif2b3: Translation initiation factor eIF-2B subunit gamma (Rattus norvegicus) [Cotesia congregata]
MTKYTEFQVVVLAGGKGSRMTELTAGKTKCLLPIHNVPMIWYSLKSLENAGFTEAIVIVIENTKKEITAALDKLNLNIKLELVGIPESEDLGTADAVRYIHDKIHKDFIVVSCDLIADINIPEVLNLYRRNKASITAVMFPLPKIPLTFVVPGPKSKQKPETDLIGIDNKTNRLVFLASASDFEEDLYISQKLLQKHTNFTMHSKLLDAHFYVISKWVLDFLVHNKSFGTLKGELFPYIVKKQLSRPPKPSVVDDKNASVVKMDLKDDIYRFAVESKLDTLIRKMSAFNDHDSDLDNAYHDDIIRCYAYMIPNNGGLRANTVQMYSFANSMTSGFIPSNVSLPVISSLSTVKSTQISNCNVDEGALIDEKTSVKDSHIGPASIIEPKTRVSNCVIMGNVTIKERCVVQNCILCNGCIVEEGCELKDCLVGTEHVVRGGSNHSREVLTESDRFMEI